MFHICTLKPNGDHMNVRMWITCPNGESTRFDEVVFHYYELQFNPNI